MFTQIKTSAIIAKRIIVASFLLTSVWSCRTAELAVDQQLKTDSEIYTVKGRQGSHIGQILTFGDFKTSKVKRGWTFGYSIPFIVKFNGTSEKISFSQSDKSGHMADIALISRFRETELTGLEEYFSVSLNYKNYCAGSVKINGSSETWDFVIHNIDGAERSLKMNSTAGFIRHGQTQIEISGIRQLENSSPLLTVNDVYGYEYRLNGKTIGAVSTINSGKIWLNNGLNEELRLVLASVSSGLMLRNSVEDQTISMK